MIVAIVPAAGESRRMGRPKLALPLGGRPLLDHVLTALLDGGVDHVVVIAPPTDRPGSAAILEITDRDRVSTVIPDLPPAQMRDSIALGISALPDDAEIVLLTPADSPAVTPSLVRRIVNAAVAEPDRIHIPTEDGRRGHPIALPRSLIERVHELPADVGLNYLIAREASRVREWPVDDPWLTDDLDTPDDYERWSNDPRFRAEPE